MAKTAARHRIERLSSTSIGAWRRSEPTFKGERLVEGASVDCGWGRLIFAHTFEDNAVLAEAIKNETEGKRNLALYLRDPHVVLSLAPQELFLDPSHTYRLWLAKYNAGRVRPAGFVTRRLQRRSDAEGVGRLLKRAKMVAPAPDFIWDHRKSSVLKYFIAEDANSGKVIGTVTGVDHAAAFSDPENGSSMWCLAVDPEAAQPGIGRALVARIADHFMAQGRSFMDLSVMHDNTAVIRLYEDLGFERVPAFCVKRRNAINRELYVGKSPATKLNPYAKIIVDEALRRGINVEVLDAQEAYFTLHHGGRTVMCRESLSELTSAVAMSRCDNKRVTHRVMRNVGVRVPEQIRAGDPLINEDFLSQHGSVVVKPARGEQGRGVSVNIATHTELRSAIRQAKRLCDEVLIEEYVTGQDLRVVLIDFQIVAAAVRKPATVVGSGEHSIADLIAKQSRRRKHLTGGESLIPIDEETERCVKAQGFALDDVLEAKRELQVRATANLHTGGTLHDVTDELSPALCEVSKTIARELDMPVVGLDFIVESAEGDDYVLIEANERPGLANHEPRPTAQRFIDLLFPETSTQESKST